MTSPPSLRSGVPSSSGGEFCSAWTEQRHDSNRQEIPGIKNEQAEGIHSLHHSRGSGSPYFARTDPLSRAGGGRHHRTGYSFFGSHWRRSRHPTSIRARTEVSYDI